MVLIYAYATHSYGLYDELMKNPFTKVNVVGFGTKWNGFFDKMYKMCEEFKKLPPDTIIMFIDGFDTRIIKDPKIAEERYLTSYPHRPVLFSLDMNMEIPFGTYLQKRVFGDGIRANAGMYMGPAYKIVDLINKSVNFKSECKNDDQCAFNKNREHFEIDHDSNIFHNMSYSERKNKDFKTNAIILQFPGELSFSRIIRSIKEYTPFLWKEIIVFILSFIIIVVIYNKVLSRFITSRMKTFLILFILILIVLICIVKKLIRG